MIRASTASELRMPLQPAASGVDLSALSTATETELQFAAQADAGTETGKGLDTPEFREKFQEFVAGTFYKTMLKAMRQGQGKVPYLHGGMAEDMFQQHLDSQLAEELSGPHGGLFTEQLYQNYRQSFGLPAQSTVNGSASGASAGASSAGIKELEKGAGAGRVMPGLNSPGLMNGSPWSEEGMQHEFSVDL